MQENPLRQTRLLRVLVVDDQALIREGVISRLASNDDVEVVGQADSLRQAVLRAKSLTPDIAIVDFRLPDGNGFAVCRRIKEISPSTKCVLYSAFRVDIDKAREAGACAVVLKQLVGDQLNATINEIALSYGPLPLRPHVDPQLSSGE